MDTEKIIQELQLEIKLLREIIDQVHEAVYVVDAEENIMLYNDEMGKIEGFKREDVIGKPELEVYSLFKGPHYNTVVTKPIKKKKKPLLDQIYTYYFPDGRATNFMFNAYPFYDDQQCIQAIYSIGRNMNQIESFIAETIELNNLITRNEHTDKHAAFFLDDIIGKSKSIREAIKLSRKVAVRSSPILLYGSTGTGKELFAQGIHNASFHAKGPFVPINCAAIPETLLEATLFGTQKGAFTGAVDMIGMFEQAEGGTLFLDEVNSMPQQLQAKLLRVLQERTVRRLGGKKDIAVNCRIISACNQNPFEGNQIREDFLYRIATVVIHIAPLKERKEDIPVLTRYFIKKNNLKFGLFVDEVSPQLLDVFKSYSWPGNVRELENVIETTMNMIDMHTTQLHVEHLPDYICSRMSIERMTCEPEEQDFFDDEDFSIESDQLKTKLWNYEKKIVENALQKHHGNVTHAAEELGILRQNLHYRIRRFGISNAVYIQQSERE